MTAAAAEAASTAGDDADGKKDGPGQFWPRGKQLHTTQVNARYSESVTFNVRLCD